MAAPTDSTSGNKCPVGHYCPEGSAQPILCSPGTYTDTELNSECLACTPGHYCITGSNPEDCPAGYFCPEGTGHVWQPCPTGTFSATSGLSNSTECTLCTGGFYCDSPNSTDVSGPCDAGYFCRTGSDSRIPSGLNKGDAGICPLGHFCPAHTDSPKACPAGTYNNQTGLTSEDQCRQCPEGYYCEQNGLPWPSGQCEAGFYCSGGSNTSRPDTVTSTGGPCPAGSYCPEGSSLPRPCEAGTYTSISIQVNCTDCPPGYYCLPGATNITDCPTGKYTKFVLWYCYSNRHWSLSGDVLSKT